MTTHNPYQADYDKAAAALAPVEEELTAFKQTTLGQRVADAIDTDDAARQIREAGAQLLEALGRYRADADTALQLVLDVYPRGGGRRVQPDPRVDGWAEVARTIAAAEIQPVTVNTDPMARYR
jgi:hypothetical protein